MRTIAEFEPILALQELVEIDSQTDSMAEQQALDWVHQTLLHLHIDSIKIPKRGKDSRYEEDQYAAVIAKIEGGRGSSGKSAIISNGHIDVVNIGSGWTRYQGETEGTIMYGRGTTDMKSGVIAQIAALDMFANSDDRSDYDQWALIVGGEETTSWGTEDAIEACKPEWRRYNSLAATIAEPTTAINLDGSTQTKVMNGNKGCFSAEIKIQGDDGHAAESFGKINSIRMARDIDLVLEALGKKWEEKYCNSPLGLPVLTPTIINGGVAANSLPPETTLRYDGRFPLELQHEYEADLRESLRDFPEAILRILYSANPAYTDSAHSWVQANLRVFGQQRAELPVWTTDGCFFSGYTDGVHAGIPLVIAGPGFLDKLHVIDEMCDTSLILPWVLSFLAAGNLYVQSLTN